MSDFDFTDQLPRMALPVLPRRYRYVRLVWNDARRHWRIVADEHIQAVVPGGAAPAVEYVSPTLQGAIDGLLEAVHHELAEEAQRR